MVDHTDTLAETDDITDIEFTGGGITTTGSPYEIDVNTATLRIKHDELDAAYNMVSNYNITVVKSHVTITNNATPIVITSATENLVYNGTAQTKNVYKVTENGVNVPAIDGTNGLQFKLSTNDKITITPTFAGITNVDDNASNNNVFTYALEHADQYDDVTTVFGTLTVTPAELTVTADNKSRPYGQENPTFTATYGGLVNGETAATALTGAPVFTCDATTTSTLGTYDIDIAIGTLVANHGNYTFTSFEPGVLTIQGSVVTLTAADSMKTYDGTALTQPRFTASALETGDSHTFTVAMTSGSTITNAGTQANVIATVDGVAITAAPTEVGTYTITPAGDAVQGNYNE